jgi:hypothetical protein
MKSDPARNNKPPPASPKPNMQPAGQGMEISSCLRRGAFRRGAFGPNGDGLEDFGPCWTPRGHYVFPSAPREPTRARAYDFEHGGTRYTAGIGRFKIARLRKILNTGNPGRPLLPMIVTRPWRPRCYVRTAAMSTPCDLP